MATETASDSTVKYKAFQPTEVNILFLKLVLILFEVRKTSAACIALRPLHIMDDNFGNSPLATCTQSSIRKYPGQKLKNSNCLAKINY